MFITDGCDLCVVQHGPPHLMNTLTVSSASDGSANLTATSRPSTEPLKPHDSRSVSDQSHTRPN